MTCVVTLGEVMLRLKSPGFERLFQSPVLEATFGGAEANVAASLAQFGVSARFVSAVPANNVGDACIASLRAFGVDTSMILRRGDRLGVYYLETGANQRPSRVTYDRAASAIATARPADFDWDAVFDGADWFHVSGVTPAISASAAELSLAAAKAARERNVTVSCDYNHRKNLWRYGKRASDVMRELVSYADVGVANEGPRICHWIARPNWLRCSRSIGTGCASTPSAPSGASGASSTKSHAARSCASNSAGLAITAI